MHLIDSLSSKDKQILEKSTVFKGISANEMNPFLSACQIRVYRTGQIILSSGNSGDGLYVVLEGTVEVFLPQGDMKHKKNSQDGYKTILATLEPGECFGEYSLIDQKIVSASVDALVPARLFHLPTRDFHQISGNDLRVENIIYKNILQILISRCREANQELDDDMLIIY